MKWFKFFDDPIAKIADLFFHVEQDQMRSAIKAKYNNKLLEQTYWFCGTKNEFEGLSDDPDERMVQRLTLSQVGILIAHRLYSRRNWLLLPALLLISIAITYGYYYSSYVSNQYIFASLCLFFGFLLIFGTTALASVFAHFLLPHIAIRKDEINEIEAMIKRCVIRDLADDTPKDLLDRRRILSVDKFGNAVTGQLLASDLEFSYLRSEWQKTINILRLVGIAFITPVLISIHPILFIASWYIANLLFSIEANKLKTSQKQHNELNIIFGILKFIILPIVFLVFIYFNQIDESLNAWLCLAIWLLALASSYLHISALQERAIMLNQSVKENGTELLIDKAGKEYFINIENAKDKQITKAKQDDSAFFTLGKSTGLFAQRRDPFAPTQKGLELGLSTNDLSTHLFILGASGTGKTYGVIRPITKQWVDMGQNGLIVLDGKGTLPLEIQEYCSAADYSLISPKSDHKFNPILNMSVDTFTDTLATICISENETDPFWSDSAKLMLRMIALAITENNMNLSFHKILDFLSLTTDERKEFLTGIDTNNQATKNMITFWLTDFDNMDEKLKSNIVNIVRTWIGNITNSKILAEWVETDNNALDIEHVFIGKKIGVLLPETEYGIGGSIISALCLARIYDFAKQRGDAWKEDPMQTSVLLVADEIQNLLNKNDLENIPIARSLGLYLMMATQNIDGLYERLGKDGSLQMLGNFASLISFPSKTKDSNEYLSARVGHIWKSTVSMYKGLPDSQTEFNLFTDNGSDMMMKKINLYRQNHITTPRLAYSFALHNKDLLKASSRTLEDLIVTTVDDGIIDSPHLILDVFPIVNPNEIDTLLAKPHTAIAIFNRASVVRRDVIDLGG